MRILVYKIYIEYDRKERQYKRLFGDHECNCYILSLKEMIKIARTYFIKLFRDY